MLGSIVPVRSASREVVRFGGKPTDPPPPPLSSAQPLKSPAAAPTAFHPVAGIPVTNVVSRLQDYNLYETDPALREALRREGGQWAEPRVRDFGKRLGQKQTIDWGFKANKRLPELVKRDENGISLNEVEYDDAYHHLMKLSKEHGVHSLSWTGNRPGSAVARAAMFIMDSQVEAGHICPITMTHAGVAVLRKHPEIDPMWLQKMLAPVYDARALPMSQKEGLTMGMAMTEIQGGTDLPANLSKAEPVGERGPGKEYELSGHKWFCSAPMSDAFLMTAKTDKGMSCFLVPKWLPDGRPNNILIQQLKDKLGNQSNASSEIELYKAKGYLVGEEGRGIPTIMRMVNFSRLDCALGSTGLMRQALVQAVHHARNRSVGGSLLIDKPAMQNKLADLALESEASTAMVMRLARAMDEADHNKEAAALARIGTALAKFWVCEQAPNMIKTAAEAMGGKGYVEDSIMPRLFRESLVNIIWEGTGVVNCLDVAQRNLTDPAIVEAFFKEVEQAKGMNPDFDKHLAALKQELRSPGDLEYRAQQVCEQLALALQASLLLRFSPPEVSQAFCASRLGDGKGKTYGSLRVKVDAPKILNRAFPPRS